MNAAKTLGDRLREARAAARLSQDELAVLCGVSKATVSDWERGRMNPRVEQLPALRQHLMVSLDHLICGQMRQDAVRQYARVMEGAPVYLAAAETAAAQRLRQVESLFPQITEAQQAAVIGVIKSMIFLPKLADAKD